MFDSERGKCIKEMLELWARSPMYAAVVTLGVAATGVLASVASQEIRGTFFSVWPWWKPFSLTASLFWLLFVGTGLLFWVQQWAVQRARAREQGRLEAAQNRLQEQTRQLEASQEKLHESSHQLMEAVRTMPPRGFLTEFGTIYRASQDAVFALLEAGDEPVEIEEVQDAIRVLLLGMAKLAREFEDEPTDEPYSANVMLYLRREDVPEEVHREAIEQRLLFCEQEVTVRKLRGVLDLRRDLSATTAKEDAPDGQIVDEGLKELAMAIPQMEYESVEREGRQRSRVLPGAPQAWVSKRLEVYTKTEDLLSWCKEKGAFGDSVMSQLQEYFGSNGPTSRIGSFISVHLSRGEGSEEGANEDPIGVVNIHRRSAGILKNQPEAADLFSSVSRPLRLLLFSLLLKLKDLEFKKYQTWEHLAEPDEPKGLATRTGDA